jgi:hypothetical protein
MRSQQKIYSDGKIEQDDPTMKTKIQQRKFQMGLHNHTYMFFDFSNPSLSCESDSIKQGW